MPRLSMSAQRQRSPGDGRDTVAIVLALGLVIAFNLITCAVLYDAVRSDTPGLSENATQILTTAFGGIVGVLGGYIGGRAVERAALRRDAGEVELSDAEPAAARAKLAPDDAAETWPT